MMAIKNGDIYLGLAGSEVLISPFGRKYKIGNVEKSRSEYTASGRLVKDVWATKKKITLAYEYIDGDALTVLIDLYDLHEELSIKIYSSPTAYNAYTVLMEPFDSERVILQGNGLWSGVTVELNEV
jgi:hypothetical protein